jgi:hypothetical protein
MRLKNSVGRDWEQSANGLVVSESDKEQLAKDGWPEDPLTAGLDE